MSDINERSKTTSSSAKLEDLLYQFLKLYDNWSLELKMVGKREAELIKTVETFDEKIESLNEVKETVKQSIQQESKTAMTAVAHYVGQEVQKYCKKDLDFYIGELNRALCYADRAIPKIKRIEEEFSLRLWAIVISVSLLVGFAAGAGWVSHTTVSIDDLKQMMRSK